MEMLKPKVEDYPGKPSTAMAGKPSRLMAGEPSTAMVGKHIKIEIDNPDLDFTEAKDLAKRTAKEIYADPMLLSWYQGKTGESYPNLECGPGDKPAWIVYAESRGGDLTIDINEGQYVFIYLSI